jgi:Ca2+:H+ antiporter
LSAEEHMLRRWLPLWTWLAPLAGWALLAADHVRPHPALSGALGLGLILCVIAAVHHAEVVAHRVGQPLGTLLLALAVTVIEVALIVALMLADPVDTVALARDTVFAEVMIILNGMVGLCLILGGSLHREQAFGLHGVSAALATLATLAVVCLVLPNATGTPGPFYSTSHLAFVGVVSLVLYLVFVFVQTVRHRDYFLPEGEEEHDPEAHIAAPAPAAAVISALLLLACLGAVVLSAEHLAPAIEARIEAIGAPPAVLGILIGLIVLLPESLAALKAAHANRLQTSLNLALGSALASIGLTIPAVAAVVVMQGWSLALGIDARGTVLLALSLLVAALSLGTGRTTVLQGAVHLVIFAIYLFTTLVP